MDTFDHLTQSLGTASVQQSPINIDGFRDFMQNPIKNLLSRRFQIPEGMENPNDIINYLLTSKQITQEQYNQAYGQYRNMKSTGTLPKIN